MGTDIHAVFQRQTSKGWEDVDSKWEQNRHYQLFAVLAGVRNGYGFAGIPTGDPVVPISEPRGFPLDFEMHDEDHNGTWMGDHSHSWLTAEEILAWKPPKVVKTGVIDRQQWETWDKKPPSMYSGGVSGPNIIVIAQEEAEGVLKDSKDWTHVQVAWEQDLCEELAYFFDEVRRLGPDVRLVFGFDS